MLSLICPSTPGLQSAVLPPLFSSTTLLGPAPELSEEEEEEKEQVEEDREEAPR